MPVSFSKLRITGFKSFAEPTSVDILPGLTGIVGPNGCGKSTLFNRLTRADVVAADMLFATLDPPMRLIKLPHGGAAILSDTVGFISDLPTLLISAFRATLEEVLSADVILHVRDIAHADSDAHIIAATIKNRRIARTFTL